MDVKTEMRDDLRSYLLRLWREPTGWRVGVKAIPTGRWHYFASLDAATAFIATRQKEQR